MRDGGCLGQTSRLSKRKSPGGFQDCDSISCCVLSSASSFPLDWDFEDWLHARTFAAECKSLLIDYIVGYHIYVWIYIYDILTSCLFLILVL